MCCGNVNDNITTISKIYFSILITKIDSTLIFTLIPRSHLHTHYPMSSEWRPIVYNVSMGRKALHPPGALGCFGRAWWDSPRSRPSKSNAEAHLTQNPFKWDFCAAVLLCGSFAVWPCLYLPFLLSLSFLPPFLASFLLFLFCFSYWGWPRELMCKNHSYYLAVHLVRHSKHLIKKQKSFAHHRIPGNLSCSAV